MTIELEVVTKKCKSLKDILNYGEFVYELELEDDVSIHEYGYRQWIISPMFEMPYILRVVEEE